MADVFISYKRENRAVAEAIDNALRASGYSTWWDTSLIAGEHFNGAIERELAAARCVLVLWTEASHASQWVQAEAIEGFNRQLLVAARLDEVALKYPFGIVQTADLRGYQPGAAHEGIEQIIEGVSAKVGRAPAAAAPIAASIPKPIAEPVQVSAPNPAPATPRPIAAPSGGLSTTVLFFGLLLAMVAASIGRNAPITLIMPITQEFGMAASQLSLLMFAGPLLFGVVVGVVLALVSDAVRASRGWIILGGLALCGGATILQGQATSAALFFAGRFIVLASIAATMPVALSLLYDKAERWLATLIALLVTGSSTAAGLTTTSAGFLSTAVGWRTALLSLGLATLALAALSALFLAGVARDPRLAQPSPQRTAYDVGNLLALLAGYVAVGIASQAITAFAALILARDYGFSPQTTGITLAASAFGAAAVSIIAGVVADAIAQRNRLAYARVSAGGAVVAAVAMALFAFAPSVGVTLLGFVLATLAGGAVMAPVFAAMRYGVAGRWWATFAAVFALGYSGLGALGPALGGVLMGIGGRAQAFGVFAALLFVASILFFVASSGTARATGGDDIAEVFQ